MMNSVLVVPQNTPQANIFTVKLIAQRELDLLDLEKKW